jgi:pimeloyl-ACP methyl ester carboxylesterase
MMSIIGIYHFSKWDERRKGIYSIHRNSTGRPLEYSRGLSFSWRGHPLPSSSAIWGGYGSPCYQNGSGSCFRGVGESGGSYGEGLGERDDAKAAADYLYSRLKNNHSPLILVGYSFGAWVGFPIAIEDERFEGMVAVAPPLEIYNFEFLKGCRKKKLFIAGNRDFFCPLSMLEEWYQGLNEPKSLTIIPGADHFLLFHTRFLIEPLKEFLRNS